MSDKSKIEWTEATWNPVTGCSKVSQGCKNCYAGALAETRLKHLPEYVDGFYNNVKLHPDRLSKPLSWRKPRRIFVNSMSDLFHEDVPFEFIAAVFAIMAATPQHTYQILTKRPKRMLEFFEWVSKNVNNIPAYTVDILVGFHIDLPYTKYIEFSKIAHSCQWPLSNAHIGVSVENQATANERIHLLLQAPAAVRWLSLEPLLGPIELSVFEIIDPNYPHSSYSVDVLTGERYWSDGDGDCEIDRWRKLDWVVVGGESGHKARPMKIDWVRDIRDQCKAAGTAYFFKQRGEYDENGNRVGKTKAGRILDGVEHNEYPN